MSAFAPAPPPPTKLGVYRTLSPRAGVHVSPLCLGAMSIGDKWSDFMGSMDKESSFKLLDAYFDMGGNFIDTANNYQDETSEEFIGEWAEKRGVRDQLFIATKYTTLYRRADPAIKQKVQFVGNNIKSMTLSVEASLKKLRTTYIDLFYVHWWDWDTTIEEVMDGLHNLVVQGKVLYLGVSDTPAWVVAKANQYAKDHGKTPFVVYQGEWNIMQRSFERDIIPMARDFGMALAPWGVLAGGKLRTDAEEQARLQSGEEGRKTWGDWKRNDAQVKVSRALEKVAGEVGAKSITSVAIAYVMQKTTHVFPIIGGRKVEQLQQNLEALDITLTAEQIKFLESQVEFDIGFPVSMIGDGSDVFFGLKMAGTFQKIPYSKALGAPEL
ncbi:putative aryl-alcohol dehydrogenase [Moniliophthora roreri MCA 2997]|uniref:Aryl-alcohol dehydrogenase n=1 Tax=Moniliophthora roreri (strain MCA 2997) TaxID=1381753 RepID=V2WLF9_MONRO|nr:putative aryl-alcohol dehydrogenase [Moniliophthora roreri MCA 2997]